MEPEIESTRPGPSDGLLSLTDNPTMASPWASEDDGEAWVWGDFFVTIQKRPCAMAEGIARMMGKGGNIPTAIKYDYAATVFYDKSKNPYGPSSRPIMSIGFERSDVGALAQFLGGESDGVQQGLNTEQGPLFIGVDVTPENWAI